MGPLTNRPISNDNVYDIPGQFVNGAQNNGMDTCQQTERINNRRFTDYADLRRQLDSAEVKCFPAGDDGNEDKWGRHKNQRFGRKPIQTWKLSGSLRSWITVNTKSKEGNLSLEAHVLNGLMQK